LWDSENLGRYEERKLLWIKIAIKVLIISWRFANKRGLQKECFLLDKKKLPLK